jgi:hypothetical protein
MRLDAAATDIITIAMIYRDQFFPAAVQQLNKLFGPRDRLSILPYQFSPLSNALGAAPMVAHF